MSPGTRVDRMDGRPGRAAASDPTAGDCLGPPPWDNFVGSKDLRRLPTGADRPGRRVLPDHPSIPGSRLDGEARPPAPDPNPVGPAPTQ